jgi:haloalkane dehalogenase
MIIPEWLNKEEYPFTPKTFSTPAGGMSYVDEGSGDPIVFVHGNPSWSFEFRNIIKGLRGEYRCIAPDHIGFGLSDKPLNFSYKPRDHAKNLELFLESLKLKKITLVVGDWGGPIGLSYAKTHPERIKNIVITNTWMWSVHDDWYYRIFSGMMGGPIGRFLIRRYNFFARVIVKKVFGDKTKLTSEIHRQYAAPLDTPEKRKGSYVFPKEIIGSSDWLASLWEQREIFANKNIVILWGMKDIAFRKKELKTWRVAFPDAKVVEFPDAGHFVVEEKPKEVCDVMREFLR